MAREPGWTGSVCRPVPAAGCVILCDCVTAHALRTQLLQVSVLSSNREYVPTGGQDYATEIACYVLS
jgi:hypothetical protein